MEPTPANAYKAEATGLFLFGVGVFGAYYHPVMKHWAILGVLPLDWFYLVLLLAGIGLMYANSPLAPWSSAPPPRLFERAGPTGLALLFLARSVLMLAMAGTLVLYAMRPGP